MNKERPMGDSRVIGPSYERWSFLDEDSGCPAIVFYGHPETGLPAIPGGWRYLNSATDGKLIHIPAEKRFMRINVKRIEFHDSLRLAAPDAWDASEAGDGSVLAWRAGDELHFAAEGGVIAPEDCEQLFADYANCREIHFNGCFDTSRATKMKRMFEGCTSLTALDLSGFDTSRVTNMENMFLACRSLTGLDVSGFDTSRAMCLGGMFYDCERLQSLNLSGFRIAEGADVRAMFRDCGALRPERIPGFAGLPAQARESLPAAGAGDRSSKRGGGEARRMDGEGDRRVLKHGDGDWIIWDLDVSPHAGPTVKYEFYLVNGATTLDRAPIRSITFHDTLSGLAPGYWDASEAKDGSVLAWRDGYELHIAAEGGVIAPKDCRELFGHYSSCEEIHFNGCFDTSRVTDMRDMFRDCESLTSLDLSGFDTSRVTDMRGMFDNCCALRRENIRGFAALPPEMQANLP